MHHGVGKDKEQINFVDKDQIQLIILIGWCLYCETTGAFIRISQTQTSSVKFPSKAY